VLARGSDHRAGPAAAHHRTGGPVAEQRGRDDVAFCRLSVAERQGAQLDDQHQHRFSRHRRRQRRGPRQTDGTAGTTEAKDRQPLDRARQPQPLEQYRVEARRRNPGGRNDDDRAELVRPDFRAVEQTPGDHLEEGNGGAQVGTVALGPGMRAIEPFGGDRRIAPAHAAIREQPVELGRPPEHALEASDYVFLVDSNRAEIAGSHFRYCAGRSVSASAAPAGSGAPGGRAWPGLRPDKRSSK
jgi:hypothetical protein